MHYLDTQSIRKELDTLIFSTQAQEALDDEKERKKQMRKERASLQRKKRMKEDPQFAERERARNLGNKNAKKKMKCLFPFKEEIMKSGICLNLDAATVDNYLQCHRALVTSSGKFCFLLLMLCFTFI